MKIGCFLVINCKVTANIYVNDTIKIVKLVDYHIMNYYRRNNYPVAHDNLNDFKKA